jgi:hypothetical protein
LKGEQKEAEKPPVTEKEKERADLEKKLKNFLQNQEMARKSRSTADQKDERETAWKELPGVARAGWIMAYYAENSGDFEVMPKPQFSACRTCGGTGTVLVSVAGANVSRAEIGTGNTEQVGWLLYTNYLVPFEVASLLLLVAMIGAIVLARKES